MCGLTLADLLTAMGQPDSLLCESHVFFVSITFCVSVCVLNNCSWLLLILSQALALHADCFSLVLHYFDVVICPSAVATCSCTGRFALCSMMCGLVHWTACLCLWVDYVKTPMKALNRMVMYVVGVLPDLDLTLLLLALIVLRSDTKHQSGTRFTVMTGYEVSIHDHPVNGYWVLVLAIVMHECFCNSAFLCPCNRNHFLSMIVDA